MNSDINMMCLYCGFTLLSYVAKHDSTGVNSV